MEILINACSQKMSYEINNKVAIDNFFFLCHYQNSYVTFSTFGKCSEPTF